MTAGFSFERAAVCRGISPYSFRALGSAPAIRQRFTPAASAVLKKSLVFQVIPIPPSLVSRALPNAEEINMPMRHIWTHPSLYVRQCPVWAGAPELAISQRGPIVLVAASPPQAIAFTWPKVQDAA